MVQFAETTNVTEKDESISETEKGEFDEVNDIERMLQTIVDVEIRNNRGESVFDYSNNENIRALLEQAKAFRNDRILRLTKIKNKNQMTKTIETAKDDADKTSVDFNNPQQQPKAFSAYKMKHKANETSMNRDNTNRDNSNTAPKKKLKIKLKK